MGLGSDWAPSGSKNLLGEMKVAWLANQAPGQSVHAPERSWPWRRRTRPGFSSGTGNWAPSRPGKRADLLVIDGQQGDDYLRLIQARETDITLVLIEGVPRLGWRG